MLVFLIYKFKWSSKSINTYLKAKNYPTEHDFWTKLEAKILQYIVILRPHLNMYFICLGIFYFVLYWYYCNNSNLNFYLTWYIYLSMYLYISVYVFTYISIYVIAYTYLSIYVSICLPIYVSICLPIYLSILAQGDNFSFLS